MYKSQKILLKILSGRSDSNIDFSDLLNLLNHLGFSERISGSHHIFFKNGVSEIINIQPAKDNKSKDYQIKQIRNIIIKYKLGDIENE
jgi:hypothetical protein